MKLITLYMPEPWLELIDKARGELDRSVWLRDIIRDALRDAGIWPENEKTIPLSLEQQINALWESRGLEVLEERVRNLGPGKFEWVIIAQRKETT